MKVVKPAKLPVLHRVVELGRRPYFHVAGILAFPLSRPRALCDELTFWQTAAAALGEGGVFDEGFAKARGELFVCGSFFAPPGKPVTASFVRARLGNIDKRLAVVGNRTWRNQVPTEPEPFTTMPIDWAHAFGGVGFDRNPYGKGDRARRRGRAAAPRAAQRRILRADDAVAERAAGTRGVHVDGRHVRATTGARGDVRQALSRRALPRDAGGHGADVLQRGSRGPVGAGLLPGRRGLPDREHAPGTAEDRGPPPRTSNARLRHAEDPGRRPLPGGRDAV